MAKQEAKPEGQYAPVPARFMRPIVRFLQPGHELWADFSSLHVHTDMTLYVQQNHDGFLTAAAAMAVFGSPMDMVDEVVKVARRADGVLEVFLPDAARSRFYIRDMQSFDNADGYERASFGGTIPKADLVTAGLEAVRIRAKEEDEEEPTRYVAVELLYPGVGYLQVASVNPEGGQGPHECMIPDSVTRLRVRWKMAGEDNGE